MVAISEAFLKCLEDKARQEAMTTNLALFTYKRYVDDGHGRFETIQHSHSSLNILNKRTKQYNKQCKIKTNHKLFRRYHYKQWHSEI